MYIYDEFDRTLVDERVREFRDQVARRLSGELTEEEFKPLRLMNGVYLQLHAYMLRIAIPYGTLSSDQMRMLAHVARRYDRGYGHFTTRQNIQFNWIKLEELPDAMADLARAGLHGMQTSGNCVRNITTDQWAGVAPDEIEDPRGGENPRHRPAHVPQRGRRDRLRGDGGRRARAHPVSRQDHKALPAEARSAELRRGDHAHVQPVRPTRQHLQGAHQDSGPRARRGEICARGRGGVAVDQGRRARARPRRGRRYRGAIPLSRLRGVCGQSARAGEGARGRALPHVAR